MADVQITEAANGWVRFELGPRQLDHLQMLCRFHLAESTNERAKAATRRLLYCLEHWPRPAGVQPVVEPGMEAARQEMPQVSVGDNPDPFPVIGTHSSVDVLRAALGVESVEVPSREKTLVWALEKIAAERVVFPEKMDGYAGMAVVTAREALKEYRKAASGVEGRKP